MGWPAAIAFSSLCFMLAAMFWAVAWSEKKPLPWQPKAPEEARPPDDGRPPRPEPSQPFRKN